MAHSLTIKPGDTQVAAREIQVKTRRVLNAEELFRMGAICIGSGTSLNLYLGNSSHDKHFRIRVAGEVYHYTEKTADTGDCARVKELPVDHDISEKEAKEMMHKHGVSDQYEINYRLFSLDGVIISIDEITGLGHFMEICSTISEEHIFSFLERVGIDQSECFRESYLDLLRVHKTSWLTKKAMSMHRLISEVTFGISSGIKTAAAMMTGMFFALPRTEVVAASLIGLGVCDSLGESYSMFNSKIAEGNNNRVAFRHAFYTAFGNVVIPGLFLIPVYLVQLRIAIFTNLLAGGIILLGLSTFDSMAKRVPKFKKAVVVLLFAAFIVVVATIAEMTLPQFFKGRE